MLKTVLPLSFIVGTRFFGLFIVLPVLSLYSSILKDANDFLVGLLVGLYALAQMILQVPFGILSDKIGRKKTLLIGLLVFILGSIICANANDIYTMILGRTLQGAGAIGAVATAMISDFIVEEQRSKAMAIMGMFIGLAFALSMVIAPIMSAKWGLSSLFELSAILTVICIILLFTIVPKEVKIKHENTKTPLKVFFTEKNFFIMNFTNFMQKMLMSIAFFTTPIIFVKMGVSSLLGTSSVVASEHLWKLYTVSMIFGFFAMGIAGSLGEKRGFSKQFLILGVFLFLIYCVAVALSLYAYDLFLYKYIYTLIYDDLAFIVFIIAVFVFFIAFNLHEPIMQSCASKFAKVNEKGAALGVFNAFGYFGAFIGGSIIGLAFHYEFEIQSFAILSVLSLLWLILLFFLKNPKDFKNLYLDLNEDINIKEMQNTYGVIEVYKNSKNIVIKFNRKKTNENTLLEKKDK